MTVEEKSLWVMIGFDYDSYYNQLLKPVIDELKNSGSKISNPNIPPREPIVGYFTRITGVNDSAYVYSDLDFINIVGDKSTVEGILAITRKYLKPRNIGYIEGCHEFE